MIEDLGAGRNQVGERERKKIAEMARRLIEAFETDEIRRTIGPDNAELLVEATKKIAAQADKNLKGRKRRLGPR